MKDAKLLNSPTFILDILGPYPKGWEIWPKKDKASGFQSGVGDIKQSDRAWGGYVNWPKYQLRLS